MCPETSGFIKNVFIKNIRSKKMPEYEYDRKRINIKKPTYDKLKQLKKTPKDKSKLNWDELIQKRLLKTREQYQKQIDNQLYKYRNSTTLNQRRKAIDTLIDLLKPKTRRDEGIIPEHIDRKISDNNLKTMELSEHIKKEKIEPETINFKTGEIEPRKNPLNQPYKDIEDIPEAKKIKNLLDESYKLIFEELQKKRIISPKREFTLKSSEEMLEEQKRKENKEIKERARKRGHLNILLNTNSEGEELKKQKERAKTNAEEEYGIKKAKVYTNPEKVEKNDIEIDYVEVVM